MRLVKNTIGFVVMVGLLMLLVGFFLPSKLFITAETKVGATSEEIIDHLNLQTSKHDHDKARLGISDIRVLRSSPDSFYTVSSVDKNYTAYITYNMAPESDSVRLQSTMVVELGINPVSRYYGLMLDARFGTFMQNSLRDIKDACERKRKRAA